MNDSKTIVTDITSKDKTIPIMEMFGPTIQGEGLMSGTITSFLRTGGCPLRCEWCDSMHAVDPEQVKENATRMTTAEILEGFDALAWAPFITFTGGDPCMHKGLGDLVPHINGQGVKVAVETQGTLFPLWLREVDVVTFSPKPPSSGNIVDIMPIVKWLTDARLPHQRVCIKVVIASAEDLEWALDLYEHVPENLIDSFYFTAVTEMWKAPEDNNPMEASIRVLDTIGGYQTIAAAILVEAAENGIKFHEKTHVGCQLHVLLWPAEDTGV
ncbi:MAG: hypothetical protein COA78_31420 [Blastopirellula sp.]|nr:MAG: hypothetical protein COA78_31420 [Blastopirellula sp.]